MKTKHFPLIVLETGLREQAGIRGVADIPTKLALQMGASSVDPTYQALADEAAKGKAVSIVISCGDAEAVAFVVRPYSEAELAAWVAELESEA